MFKSWWCKIFHREYYIRVKKDPLMSLTWRQDICFLCGCKHTVFGR